MPWLNKTVEEDEPTAEDIRSRIEKILRAEAQSKEQAPDGAVGDSAAETASQSQAEVPARDTALKPAEERWDLLTIDECAGKPGPSEGGKQANQPTARVAGTATAESETVSSEDRPDTKVRAFPFNNGFGDPADSEFGHGIDEQWNEETMTQHAQHIQDDPVAEVSASSSTADLEDRIRDAVRPVLQEWASGELARLIERVLKEEVAQLTSNTLEQPSKSVARING